MMASGLGKSDIEPSVAESVLESMLKEYPSITIMRETRLRPATVVDNRIPHIGVVQKPGETLLSLVLLSPPVHP